MSDLEDLYELSPMQQGLLFHALAARRPGVYQISLAYVLEGRLDTVAFDEAWRRVVARHAALRTSFHWEELDKPLQAVHRQVALDVAALDWSDVPDSEQEARLARYLADEQRRDFDLREAPLLRVAVVRLAAERHRLLWTFHHAILEGWSAAIVIGEVFAQYRALLAGTPLDWPAARPYRDHILWLQAQDASAAESYWRRSLAGFHEPTPVPLRASGAGGGPGREAQALLRLSVATTEALEALARSTRVSLGTLLQGAWALLLARHAGQDDVLFGNVVSGRQNLPGAESMVGLFVNTLPCRARLDPETPLGDWLRAFQAEQLAARRFEHSALVDVQGWSAMPRGTRLFETLFTFENWAGDLAASTDGGGLRVSDVRALEGGTDYPLAVEVIRGVPLSILFSYDPGALEPDAIERLEHRYEALLEGMTTHPNARVGEIPWLSEGERRELVVGSNDCARPFPRDAALGALFTAQALRSPEAVAASYGSSTLRYRELEARSNRLARHLLGLGVGPGARVGVCVERSLDMLVGLLGILKAGGAYVPLDPAYPAERLAFMVEDAGLSVVLTQQHLEAGLVGSPARRLALDRDWPSVSRESAEPVASGVSGADLAYVIYTSGSTGVPKGVAVSQRAVARLVLNADYVQLGPEDRVAQASNASFDAATFEIWGALLNGARLVGVGRDVALAPRELARVIRDEGLTTLFLTTALFNQVASTEPGAFASLKHLLFGGEAVDPERVRSVLQEGPPARLLHVYGPTETTTFATWQLVESVPEGATTVPIGGPIANTTAYVLDTRLEPTPAGVVGELYLGGDGVALGYLNRPELTAERFVADPFGTPGGRLYRTGDLVCRDASGRLLFLGRKDHQVKLRGFRVELGEIEAALQRHPAVGSALVLVREDHPGDRRLVAYVSPATVDPIELRRHLSGSLPEYMLPAAFVALAELPLNPNGKIDRAALPAPEARALSSAPLVPARTELERALAALWKDALHLDAVGVDDNFFDLGGHSLTLLRVHGALREGIAPHVTIVDLFTYPTIATLAAFLAPPSAAPRPAAATATPARSARGSIAIVGMAGRFPGAADVEAFWQNLRAGVESIRVFSDAELAASGVPEAARRHPAYVPARGVLDDAGAFDADFFGYNPREATLMDPQQRVFLESAWTALESAGYDPERTPGRVGVYAGTGMNGYLLEGLTSPDLRDVPGGLPLVIASDKDFLTTRVSYKLNLRGPSLDIQSACSTSLVAVHVACRSLLSGECDMALAGGVSIGVPEHSGYVYQEEGILSPDGHCRAFDRRGQGTVAGSGVGVVVLKRLEDAWAEGDRVIAVILGTAINNDGARKVGYTAPGVAGQADVIAAAQAAAGVSPDTIDYVEAHGTGTALGDPIEIQALRQAFGPGAGRERPCAIGSLKTNVGHLDAAAGVAGLIKAALSLERRELPPSLHFEAPNPALELEASCFRVNAALAAWPESRGPRRAGVSSFGIGGTNAHAVLEEAPLLDASERPRRPWQLLTLSARTPGALQQARQRLTEHLAAHPELDVADVAFTLQEGRRAFRHRSAVVCRDLAGAQAGVRVEGAAPPAPGVAFLFPGQGTQYPGMLRGLYETEAVFREAFDRCAARVQLEVGLDLRAAVYPADAAAGLEQTALAQPALFAVEYALAQLWISFGVVPEALLGHSVGEYVAACLAGVFSAEDAVGLVAARGRLMQGLPPGAMLAVPLSEAEARALTTAAVSLAAINGPAQCVLSGPAEEVAAVEAALAARGVESQRLRTSHAFHSPAMEPIVAAFRERVAATERHPPRLPFVSNLTGGWISADEAVDPGYWARQLREAVRFGPGLETLASEGERVLLEVGPGQALSGMARAFTPKVVASARTARDARPDAQVLLEAAARLWVAGVPLDGKGLHAGERRRRVALPTYAFERQRFWLRRGTAPAAVDARPASLEKQADMADWFARPSWRAAPALGPAEDDAGSWLIFDDDTGLAEAVTRGLSGRVVRVAAGTGYERRGPTAYALRPGHAADYESLVRALQADGGFPTRVLHLWGVSSRVTPPSFEATQDRGFYSLLFLAQALGAFAAEAAVALTVVTTGLQQVSGEGPAEPAKATLLGPCRVIPQEYARLRCRSIDIEPPAGGAWRDDVCQALIAEALGADAEPVVAYRLGERWVQSTEPVRLPEPRRIPRLRERGVYLISGGLGGVGLELARFLAESVRARLVLVGRRGLHDAGSRVAALEALGAEVLVVAADVSDRVQMERAFEAAESRFGPVNGVVHAAGVAPGGLIQLKTREAAARVLSPKVEGTRVIHALAAGRGAEFVVLCSSLASVLGVPGQVDYCAANAFEDAFARHAAGRPGPFVVSVSWDTWSEVGMAVDAATPLVAAGRREATGLRSAEGVQAFARVLAQGLSQVLVSTVPLPARIALHRGLRGELAEAAAYQAGTRFPRPDLATPYAAPRDDIERTIADAWQELLGFESVGVHDDFFELGGHSLLAMQVVNRLRETFQVTLRLQALFEAPTVAALARVLVAAEPRPGQVAEIAQLAQGLEGLSEHELERLLHEQKSAEGCAS